MRRISANYIISPNCKSIRNGVLEFDDNGTLLQIIDPKGKELAHVEWYNGIIVPGFINAHCHLELSHLKGVIPPRQGMTGFLKGIFANSKQEFNKQALIDADAAMFHEGIVAVGDISNNDSSLPVKQKSKIYYHTFFEALGLNTEIAAATSLRIQELINKANKLNLPASAAPHAFYSMSEDLWEALKPLFKSQVSSFHHLESIDEKLFIEEQKGGLFELMTNIRPNKKLTTPQLSMAALLNKYLIDTSKVLLIHNGALTDFESDIYNTLVNKLYFVLCPLSNQYIGNPLPNITTLKKINRPICIGTDSLSSNTQLSICEEMKVLLLNNPQLTFQEVLQWATLNGAQALSVDHKLGSFEIGKQPGAVLISHFDFEQTTLTQKSFARRLM
jgi:cytosine/adenosine deaminase-related metal-dependent hydrolase